MSVMATSRPASTIYGRRTTCDRCGIDHQGHQELCRDCMDVEHPKPCKVGHERTEDNVYIPKSGKPQCGACKRMHANFQKGWAWACQICGRRADQGEVLCGRCGQTPANNTGVTYTGERKAAPGSAGNATEGLAHAFLSRAERRG